MSNDRAGQYIGAGLATLWLVGVAVLDLAIPPGTAVLASLFGLGPLIACAVLPARVTVVFASSAVVLAVASGVWDGTWGTAQQTVRILDVALVSIAAVFVATVRVHREQRFARVSRIAEVAQRAILPKLPNLPGQVAVASRYLSAARDAFIGGDLYDCYHSTTYTRFLVGDVRGKGVAAVEQAARVIRAFRQAAAALPSLPAVAQDMSSYLVPFFDDEEFVTALIVDVTDPGHLTLVSCGHPQPMLMAPDGRPALLEPPAGLPLGLGETYDALTVPWLPGERLLMYTDGLSEARDTKGQFLPVLTLAPHLTADSLDEALDLLLDAVRDHVPSAELTDDLAVVLLENITVDHPSAADGPERVADGAGAAPHGE